MSRVGNYPIDVPKGVEVTLDAAKLSVKGSKGALSVPVDEAVEIKREDDRLRFTARRDDQHSQAMAGTLRALVSNMLKGVSQGFSKKLELQGVGYRAQAARRTARPAARVLASGAVQTARRHQGGNAEPDRSDRHRRRQAVGRPGRIGNPRLPSAGTVQRQRRQIRERARRAQRSEEEVEAADEREETGPHAPRAQQPDEDARTGRDPFVGASHAASHLCTDHRAGRRRACWSPRRRSMRIAAHGRQNRQQRRSRKGRCVDCRTRESGGYHDASRSIGRDSNITVASKRWPMLPARAAWNSKKGKPWPIRRK